MTKPRIQVFGPTPEVVPGSTGAFSSALNVARATPIRLRVSDDREQPATMWLSWKTNASITVSALRILDATMRARVFDRVGGVIILNGEATDFTALVAAIKSEFGSAMTVLRYANVQRIPEGTRVASSMFSHFLANSGTELLQKVSGGPKILGSAAAGNRELWVDVTVTAALDYMASHIATEVAACGADGVAIDSLRTEMTSTAAIVDGVAKNAAWPAGAQATLTKITAAFTAAFGAGVKKLWFNGLWNHLQDGQLARQAALLPYADGASVEFFGRSGFSTSSAYYPATSADEFRIFVSEPAAVIKANPAKDILVHGSVTDAYANYRDAYEAALYIFVCWLVLAWTAGSRFIMHNTFQVPRGTSIRFMGMTLFSFQDLPLIEPLDWEEAPEDNGTDGLMVEFTGGRAYLAPDGTGIQVWTLDREMWTPRGQRLPVSTPITLQPGKGLILMNEEQPQPDYSLRGELNEDEDEVLFEHVIGEHRYRRMRGRIRTSDAAACLAPRLHVDDAPRPYAMLEMLPTGGSFPGSATKDYAYGMDAYQGATHKTLTGLFAADGQWHTFDFLIATAMSPLEAFSIPSVRIFGNIEIDYLEIYEPEAILPEIDTARPVPYFAADENGLSVDFENQSIAPVGATNVSFLWEFGDGVTSTDEDPSHTYAFTGGKSVRLTVTASNGRSDSYSAIVRPGVNADGPLKQSFPASPADFVATRVMTAQEYWRFGMASGNATGSIRGIVLTASGLVSYQQSTGVTGWTRTGPRFTEGDNQRLRNTAPGVNPAVVDSMLVAAVYLETPAAARAIMTLAQTLGIDLRILSTAKLRVTAGGTTTDGTASYNGDVYLLGLSNNPSTTSAAYETNINTPTPVAATGWSAPSGDDMGFGDVAGADAFKGVLLDAWWWFAQTFTASGNTLTVTAHGLQTGQGPVRVYTSGGTLPTGLAGGTDYYVIATGANTFQLATSEANANDGIAIVLSTAGSGTNYLRAIPTFAAVAQGFGWVTPEDGET